MLTMRSYVHMHIYIADMRTKKVGKCVLKFRMKRFLVKIANSNVMSCRCVDSVGIRIFVALE